MEEKGIALYHRVMRRENFEKAAKDLVGLLKSAQEQAPNKPRFLYLDIDGHLNEKSEYDNDMLELQEVFGIKFLLQFFTELHFPLFSITNPNNQNNDIPDSFEICNAENKKDNSLNELYIENYSNTEFMSEEDVYQYLKEVSDFLKEYNELKFDNKNKWIKLWQGHVKDLINELFTVFLYGNLISATAMTRVLIESYIYMKIIQKEKSDELLDEWYLCSIINGTKKYDNESKLKIVEIIKNYCINHNINFNEKWDFYNNKNENENSWLKSVIKEKRITFRTICEYLDEIETYYDFQATSSFIHAQDISSKILPFTFYESIYSKFYMMMSYIFKTIRLFGLQKNMDNRLKGLEKGLIKLGKNYIN